MYEQLNLLQYKKYASNCTAGVTSDYVTVRRAAVDEMYTAAVDRQIQF